MNECDYSFAMLYKAAFGKKIPRKVKTKLQGLGQGKINELVVIWAKKAGWVAVDKNGENGIIYTAFYPKEA